MTNTPAIGINLTRTNIGTLTGAANVHTTMTITFVTDSAWVSMELENRLPAFIENLGSSVAIHVEKTSTSRTEYDNSPF